MGAASAFVIALGIVAIWALSGPFFNFSDTWQLFINTGTTVATFLMVFIIQNTQNRDSKALHLKLDELIHSSKSARDSFVELENLTDDELNLLDQEFKEMHEKLHTVPVVHNLHSKIKAEKDRRGNIGSAGRAISNMLNTPLGTFKNDDEQKK